MAHRRAGLFRGLSEFEGAVAYVAEELELSESEARPGRRLLGLAAQLIDAWPTPGKGGARNACRAALRLLRRLGDDATTQRFLREVATPHYRSGDGGTEPAGFVTLWRHAASSLLARSARPPEEPADGVIATRSPCSCPHCRSLQAFCDDPAPTTLRLPLRKELRRHVHGVIDRLRLDIRHETERKGSPYTLVCTKTRGAWKRRCALYAEDIAHLRLLAGVQPSCAADAWRRRPAAGAGGDSAQRRGDARINDLNAILHASYLYCSSPDRNRLPSRPRRVGGRDEDQEDPMKWRSDGTAVGASDGE